MSFFIRLAQTRAGAERLLEAQILQILSRCDYIDATPEADQAFMGIYLSLFCINAKESSVERDSFLPSAIQRYHQLLMPALELIVALLSILGTKHTTVVNQVSGPVFGLQLI